MIQFRRYGKSAVAISPGSSRLALAASGDDTIVSLPPVMGYAPLRNSLGSPPPTLGRLSAERVQVLGLGEEALRNHQEEPGRVQLAPAIREGHSTDPFVLEQLLRELLKTAGIGRMRRTFTGMCCRWLLTPELNMEAYQDYRSVAVTLGFRQVERVDLPAAALAGVGIDIQTTHGAMVLKLGAERSTMAVYALGDNVTWVTLAFGSGKLDEAIQEYIRRRYKVHIDLSSAEEIKTRLGSLYPLPEPASLKVVGGDAMTGVEKKITLDDNEIRDVLVDACEPLVMAIQEGFHEVPPELAADISRDGVLLTGGGANMQGIAEFLGERIGLWFIAPPDAPDLALHGALLSFK